MNFVTTPASRRPARAQDVATDLLIDNRWVESASGRRFATIDPATEDVIVEVAEADAEDVDRAVSAARRAFEQDEWARWPGARRGGLLAALADLMERDIEALSRLESLDNGKPYVLARHVDLPLSIAIYRYYAGWADKIQGQTLSLSGPQFGYTRLEPVGVVGQIIPWNFPLVMQACKLAPALACGCTVVMKPAEQTPLTALRLGALLVEAGCPPGVVNLLPGYGPTAGQALARHPDVDAVAFTGSTDVGHLVMEAAAQSNLKRVSLELGGKSANIVFADADLDAAIEGAHQALFFNQGQCCMAGSRLFVQRTIYDAFVERSVARAQRRIVGPPLEPTTEQGPQIDGTQMAKILHYVEEGRRSGARLMCGGSRVGDRGFYVEPTVFADVPDDSPIARDEIFGPVMAILPFDDLDEAVSRANASAYGLAAGVWTRDLRTAQAASQRLCAGTVWVNCYNVYDPGAPFGGVKQSGFGRELGQLGLQAYTSVKTIIVE